MADQHLRTAARLAAASPSPESEGALIKQRLRAGTISQEMVALAAYCGHEASAVVGPCEHTALYEVPGDAQCWCFLASQPDLSRWVRGLYRWGPEVQVRSAVAAARCALLEWMAEECDGECGMEDRDCPLTRDPVRAIEAAETWLADQTTANLAALRNSARAAHEVGFVPGWALLDSCFTPAKGKITSAGCLAVIEFAAAQAGEAPVRTAIQAALIEWALRGGA